VTARHLPEPGGAPAAAGASPGGRRALRESLKRLAGSALASAAPQCRYDRMVFILGHMRCGSTALSQVLCAHPAISGYGEAHIAYDGADGPGRLLLNQARRGAWKRRALHLHDKILHNRHDRAAPEGFFAARAIFLVRQPEPAIRSIRHLFAAIGSAEYATDEAAAAYYGARLARLAALWHRFPAERRIGFDFAGLTSDPARVLAAASHMLGLAQPLANAYPRRARPAEGAGDPLAASHFRAIVPAAAATSLGQAPAPLNLPPAALRQLEAQYRTLRSLFAEAGLSPTP